LPILSKFSKPLRENWAQGHPVQITLESKTVPAKSAAAMAYP
jgi:hypothetical protein